MESDTPRTDAKDWMWTPARAHPGQDPIKEERVVDADFARELERELAAMQKQRDEARDIAAATHKRNWYEAKTEYGTELGKVRAELAEMRQQRDEARDYSIALQRAIEHHRRGVAVPPAIAANCPHHAQMLNEHLASKEGGGA